MFIVQSKRMINEDFYQKQISLTEWLEVSGFKNTKEFREEDNEKRERLKLLNEIIGLPFDRPTQFSAIEIVDKSPLFLDFVEKRGEELCAIRLIPTDPNLTKLRLRGEKILEAVKWFLKQEIDSKLYKVDFVPHSESCYLSTIIVVNKNGIFGEIIKDALTHLTQGFYGNEKPILFHFDFKKWKMNIKDKSVLDHLKKVFRSLLVNDIKKRKELKKIFGAKFYHNYLGGYWETTYSNEFGLWFIDYNRILGKMYKDFIPKIKSNKVGKKVIIKGSPASAGIAFGVVRIIKAEDINNILNIDKETIIVCDVTTPDFVPLMKKCRAIVTDRGGVLSHAAIVSRELNLPCIVATGNSTSILEDGMRIQVDADKGTVSLL